MRCEALPFSRVKDHHLISVVIPEHLGPPFLNGGIQPHEFVLCSALNLSVILSVEGLESRLEGLLGGIGSDKDNTESAICT